MEQLKQKTHSLPYLPSQNTHCLNPKRFNCANFHSDTIIDISNNICEKCIWKMK